jgi:hypothetical protein
VNKTKSPDISVSFQRSCTACTYRAVLYTVQYSVRTLLSMFTCMPNPRMYMYYIMDPLKGPSLHVQISSCSSLHRPIGAPNTSSYFMRNVGGKGKAYPFYCPYRPLYIENVALRAMYSLSMLEHVHCTVNTLALYVLYDLYGLTLIACLPTSEFTAVQRPILLPNNRFVCHLTDK